MTKLLAEQYTVAWLCALPASERAAAILALDERYEKPVRIVDDNNSYYYGSINKHPIVIACLPPETQGSVNAARLVAPLSRSFPNLKIYLFVGIGGGVPHNPPRRQAEDDIHLGDVVVGWPTTRGAPAVVNWDLGRVLQGNIQENLSNLEKPEWKPLQGLGNIETNHAIEETNFDEHLRKITSGHPTFSHPGIDQDRLFQADYEHPPGEDCSKCNTTKIIQRPSRTSSRLVFHRSTILSSEKVMKDGIQRDIISKVHGDARCFETEAAGIMDEKRCFIIRGIANYADSHKNWAWHKYASATAAAFARELLYTLEPVVLEPPTYVLRTSSKHEERETRKTQKSLVRWKENPRFVDVSKTFDDTYSWIWHSKVDGGPGFLEWLQDSDSKVNLQNYIFWIQGKPGSGKSTLMKYICQASEVKPIRENNGFQSNFFFHKLGTTAEKSFKGLLLACTAQICEKHTKSYSKISSIFSEMRNTKKHGKDTWTEDGAKQALRVVVSQNDVFDSMVLYIDGLDECEGNITEHLDYLLELFEPSPQRGLKIRICFASRSNPDIESRLRNFPGFAMHSLTDPDIKKYVIGKLKQAARDMPFDKNYILDELKTEVVLKAEGVFIWVRVVINQLVSKIGKGFKEEELLEVLKSLPSDLENLYEGIIREIRDEPLEYLEDAARWFEILQNSYYTHIRLLDLSFIEEEHQRFVRIPDSLLLDETSKKVIGQRMRLRVQDRSRGLIQIHEVNPGDEAYQYSCKLIHVTFEEFLRNNEQWRSIMMDELGDKVSEAKTYKDLMIIALRRAQSSDAWHPNLRDGKFEERDDVDQLFWADFQLVKFCVYARQYERCSGNEATQFLNRLDEMFRRIDKGWYQAYLKWHYQDLTSAPNLPDPEPDLLTIATHYAVGKFVEERLKKSPPQVLLNKSLLHIAFGPTYIYPVWSLDMVRALLDYGFSVNDQNNGKTVWEHILERWAFGQGYLDTVDGWPETILLLLRSGADINMQFKHHQSGGIKTSLLHLVLQTMQFHLERGEGLEGYREVLKYLFKHCANTESRDQDQKTALETVNDDMKEMYHKVEKELDRTDPGWRSNKSSPAAIHADPKVKDTSHKSKTHRSDSLIKVGARSTPAPASKKARQRSPEKPTRHSERIKGQASRH